MEVNRLNRKREIINRLNRLDEILGFGGKKVLQGKDVAVIGIWTKGIEVKLYKIIKKNGGNYILGDYENANIIVLSHPVDEFIKRFKYEYKTSKKEWIKQNLKNLMKMKKSRHRSKFMSLEEFSELIGNKKILKYRAKLN